MNKREYIKKHIDDIKNDESIEFIYWFVKSHIEEILKKENK